MLGDPMTYNPDAPPPTYIRYVDLLSYLERKRIFLTSDESLDGDDERRFGFRVNPKGFIELTDEETLRR